MITSSLVNPPTRTSMNAIHNLAPNAFVHADNNKVLVNGTTEGTCKSTTREACVKEVAALCTSHASAGCAAFSILNSNGITFELFKKGDATANPKPDGDWAFWILPEDVPSNKVSNFTLPDGVSFFVGMQTAMASDTALFKLGMVSVTTTPNIFGGE